MQKVEHIWLVVLFTLLLVFNIEAQQISISRIEQMPNSPTTYNLPNWKEIAVGYDSLIFDLNSKGEYLPAIFINTNTINYPNHNSFGIHSYIGTSNQLASEAINVLPAVIGATLAGIDKSSDGNFNWALMCEEYFNNRLDENIYLNSPKSSSGNDWWYDTMPNVFFYQLNYLYPGNGDFDFQFTKIADRWLDAINHMNASATPWHKAILYYRGWYFSSMTGNTNGVSEPEAAGSIAWILYNAFVKTGNDKYRIGAEWAMEFLEQLSENPSYELQLPYGAYIAARMNAELGTDYNVTKLLNWCFDVGSLRNWGAIVGQWGNFEVNGLIGEVNGNNDYAFAMNTFEQIGALVPLVRYNDKFARSIGKWVLNAANSARLFYPKYLPSQNQDNNNWSIENDTNSYIAYEALRKEKYSKSPFATGDAVSGGWAATNLGLYGSSHVGILGGIIDTTDVSKILKLNLLKTDYYHDETYPTYLYYNPYNNLKAVSLKLPIGNFDIYEAVNNKFIHHSVSGNVSLNIESNSAIIVVIVPSGGVIKYDLNKMLLNEKIIDYNSDNVISNYSPRIKALATANSTIVTNQNLKIYCTAVDRDQHELLFKWKIDNQIINSDSSIINWTTPSSPGNYKVTCTVADKYGYTDTASIVIKVVEEVLHPPLIEKIIALPRKIDLSQKTIIECIAKDYNGDNLTYKWFCKNGIFSGSGSKVEWNAPDVEGNYSIICEVSTPDAIKVSDSIKVMVRDFSHYSKGRLIAFYPFNSNANDESGNALNGTLFGPKLIEDRFGKPNSAYSFNGESEYIKIKNNNLLNFNNKIALNFWMTIANFYNREAYPISHGNWETRWKASITNKKLRWTINTSNGIIDLDSESNLEINKLYNITLQYSGKDLELYINNKLDAFVNWEGLINTSNIDLTIGQALPNNSNYNFSGVLDDIRIYDYNLSLDEIAALYDIDTYVASNDENDLVNKLYLKQNYPNPFNPATIIEYSIPTVRGNYIKFVKLDIYNILGKKIASLVNKQQPPGKYSISFDASTVAPQLSSGMYIYQLKVGDKVISRKMILLK